MVKHIVMWTFQSHVAVEDRQKEGQALKDAIEALIDIVPGVQQLQVQIAPIGTSTHDILLESAFDSEEALAQYQVHPAHVAVAQKVKAVAEHRACFDYQV